MRKEFILVSIGCEMWRWPDVDVTKIVPAEDNNLEFSLMRSTTNNDSVLDTSAEGRRFSARISRIYSMG